MSKKLLICDDDIDIIEMLEIVLDDSGFDIITETDSKKVLELISSTKPQLVLMDLWMPVISGDQILMQMREDQNLSSIPVVIMSAAQDGKEVASKAGANGYIPKPFDIDELMQKVNKFMS
ncbi:PleD family two-component system response regulator [Pedobacter aquatilis]|uniref:response regulator n=1 Tax=Pedobacter aquatilis TaxID=351343 RepID=UPI002930D68B|nr:response regulator [Pedobacter aquatilis]